jgi:hypothetical protein
MLQDLNLSPLNVAVHGSVVFYCSLVIQNQMKTCCDYKVALLGSVPQSKIGLAFAMRITGAKVRSNN